MFFYLVSFNLHLHLIVISNVCEKSLVCNVIEFPRRTLRRDDNRIIIGIYYLNASVSNFISMTGEMPSYKIL